MTPLLEFFVPGIPRPAGSKTAFALKKGGVYTGRAIVTDASGARGREWRQDVKQAAIAAMDGRDILTGAIEVQLKFFMPRPKGHYGTGKNAYEIKASAPDYHTGKPDVLKLARGTEDAMTGIVYRDDSATTTLNLQKKYALPGQVPGVSVIIYEETGNH